MSTSTRRPLAEMRALAEDLVYDLSPYCLRLAIAGSIRRQAPECADIELVAIPRIEQRMGGLFGDVPEAVDLLAAQLVADLATFGHFDYRRDVHGVARFGAKYKALLWRPSLDALALVPVDLFAVLPGTDAQWGVISVIRTGPAAFSQRLVTPTRQGGWLPDYLQVQDGAIRHRATGEIVPTPEEADVFRLLGRAYLAPEQRL